MSSSTITLAGSAEIVTEFFGYCINSILYQRGLYDPSTFKSIKAYGLTMQVTQEPKLELYITTFLAQLRTWLEAGRVKRLVLVITGTEDEEVLERWLFDLRASQAQQQITAAKAAAEAAAAAATPSTAPTAPTEDKENAKTQSSNSAATTTTVTAAKVASAGPPPAKSEKELQKQIGAIIRQITSAVSFLPLLEQVCTFDLLVYTPLDQSTPSQWEESDARLITQSAASVKLRGLNTSLHRVETSVAYKVDDE